MTVPSVLVEATSLSSVTEIAANPPRHPYTQPRTNAIPLTLYIARVPGSRDVFLTPHKPREKVVSAEDVLAALYYVHINSETDCRVETPVIDETDERTTARQISWKRPDDIPPLPARSQYRHSAVLPQSVQNEWMQVPQAQHSEDVNDPNVAMRKPLRQTQSDRAYPPVLLDITNAPRAANPAGFGHSVQRDMPSRPLPKIPSDSIYSESIHSNNVSLLRERSHQEDINPYFRQYDSKANANPYSSDPSEWPKGGSQATPQINIQKTSTRSRYLDASESLSAAASLQQPGSLTLIRRDPASGEQWNVACIYDPPVREVSSAALLDPPTAGRRAKKGGAPLYLDITNQSYLQFEDQGGRVDSPAASLPSPNGSLGRPSFSSDSSSPPDGVFRRRLYMPGSKHGIHAYGHAKHLSVDSAMGDDAMRRTMRQRSSVDLSAPNVDVRSKTYSFTSPWDGKCEFATGVSGKSLKCKHTLPYHSDVETVSELRFNLPASSRSTPAANNISEKRASYFSHVRKRSHDDTHGSGALTPVSPIGDDGRMDLSLGQERAGGGFGGKQAKLGKLIIEPEGLKMLDLLVAANLGLWWRAYEKP
ncbi:hypothetical protein K431DRAFT_284013 [Polychaeton citri CBS 116435]|uniref:Uncharacterized protein n=1 Tax=Polychaeton citri CBS 116435 TaxID=1314669 RepID=A0A9P4QCF4_9PEZI|nr:hypothetical protein K431DRAFT_284013 [Polychaeton citri CBS 116435]